jgi:hypothetical protein
VRACTIIVPPKSKGTAEEALHRQFAVRPTEIRLGTLDQPRWLAAGGGEKQGRVHGHQRRLDLGRRWRVLCRDFGQLLGLRTAFGGSVNGCTAINALAGGRVDLKRAEQLQLFPHLAHGGDDLLAHQP